MEIIRKYFPHLSPTQNKQLASLAPLYTDWNQKINVISRKDIDRLYEHHVLHSLAIAKYIQFTRGSKVLDVGTGGGFPGIPLAILFPQTNFTLIDSIGKKIKVVKAIATACELKNCTAIHTRAESIDSSFDFIVSRAVTSLPIFINWIAKSIAKKSRNALPNGIIALKGGDLQNELDIPNNYKTTRLSEYFEEEFFSTKKLVHVLSH